MTVRVRDDTTKENNGDNHILWHWKLLELEEITHGEKNGDHIL